MIEILLGISLIFCAILIHQILVLQSRIKELKEKEDPNPQGYSKFLEDSREAAFSYIEQVQQSILDFKKNTEAKNKLEIKQSYNRLISLLPEEKL